MKVFKKIFSLLLRIGISVALLIFLFKFNKIDAPRLIKSIKDADKPLLLCAFLIFYFNYHFCLFRWEMLLKGAKIHLPLKRVIISFAGGIFFSLFLPSTIGGDVIRTIDLAAHTKRPREVVATVLLDRLSGYVGLVLVSLIAILLGWRFIQYKIVLVYIGVLTAILIALLLVLFNRYLYSKINQILHSPTAGKLREFIRSLHHEMYVFRHHKNIIMDNLLLSICIQVITPIVFYLTALSLGVEINVLYFFIFLPIIGAITLLPISIGGLGVRDALTIFFFAKAGVNKDLALAISLMNFLFILFYAGIGGLIYVLTVHHRRIQHYPSPHLHTAH